MNVFMVEGGGGGIVRATDLGFLETDRLAIEIQIFGYWICLDFLGFSRPNLDFSIGCAGFSRENFS
jgi:hypothetical protein